MLDPHSSSPPQPDLECSIDGTTCFFELGEVKQQDIAWALSHDISQAHSRFARIWDALGTILTEKVRNNYNPAARPLSLLLYYADDPSFWELLEPIVAEKSAEMQATLESGVFDSVFLFDTACDEILFHFSRSFAPAIAQPRPLGTKGIDYETLYRSRRGSQRAHKRQAGELDSIAAAHDEYAG